VNNDLVKLGLWVVIVGGVFAYLWRKGHLMKLSTYVAETREELRKCTWPSREELTGSTVVVLVSTILLSLLVIGSDFFILKLVRGILPKL
jgi:preprotein translocase subunit SecE